MWSQKTSSLLTHMNYKEKMAFGSLKGQSLNTGGLKTQVDFEHLVSVYRISSNTVWASNLNPGDYEP